MEQGNKGEDVNATGCGFVPTQVKEIFNYLSKQTAALSSAIQHEMPPQFSGKW